MKLNLCVYICIYHPEMHLFKMITILAERLLINIIINTSINDGEEDKNDEDDEDDNDGVGGEDARDDGEDYYDSECVKDRGNQSP